jgi:hypothetical protein
MEKVLKALKALNEIGIEYVPLKNSSGKIIDILRINNNLKK